MAHPIRTASRSQRRSLRQQQRASRSTSWRIGALRPVALAACLSVSGPAHLGWAGTMNPMAALSSHAIPVPVIPFIDEATKQRQNIASYGKGKGTVTNDANNDPVKLVIDQETQKAIYNWQSFDIGQASSVVFMLPDKDSSALNRVSNSTSASRIFGSLSSYYGDGKGGLITGGEIYLINRNGILFGKTAKVNVGSLMASALDMSDDDYKSGLQSIKTNQSTFFSWKDGDIATYDPETNYVKVEEGASITTASGGRVFLLGGKVENGGQITAQNGQVVLAAGSEVYLNTPSAVNSPLYMSEANENVPAVKGLLVEVNSSRKAGEYAANTATGVINTPTGNTTIVGWAVNQSGRILATTSISQNGSVFLQARSNVVAQMTNGVTKQATQGGQLVLGDRSSIQITVDQGLDKGGQVPAISANSVFTASRVEMSGQTIEFKDRASDAAGSQAVITAPAAVVNVRAEALPAYSRANLLAAGVTPDGQGKLLVGDGVKIDVSGTKDTTVSVARNFVTTALLGGNDLKDAPIQKDGPIYRSKLTFDIREAAPILGDTSAYKNAVLKSASEFMSAGGNVSLTSTGSVATSNTASIDVSGGQVNYTSAMVNPSVLLGKNGQRYTLNTAPTDQVIVGIAGVGNMTPTRFGTQTAPSLAGMAHMEQGYTEGKDAGKLNVIAPQMVVAAKLNASTVSGRRQLSGLDALAFKGALTLGTMENVSKVGTVYQFGTSGFQSAVLQDIEVTKSVDDLSDFSNERSFGKSAISVEQINKSGFGSVTIASNGNITVDDGADLKLPQNGSLTLRAAAYAESVPVTDPATGAKSTQSIVHNGIVLGGKIQSVGGAVSIESKSLNDAAAESDTLAVGSVHLKDGQSIDVAGNWVNQRLDGTGVAPAVSGGSVSLASGRGLVIGNDVSINVSGGATMNSAGSIKGSN
ncbi:MAG: filamentous hemagglutinin N-terminal domain-containing protein, partial [Aquabacterium sp.]|uniref:two-partner secretion domain-containing protein n=1 Tax=Aquabacterium sp. TaxID=1872578 RepID=UPI0011FF225D